MTAAAMGTAGGALAETPPAPPAPPAPPPPAAAITPPGTATEAMPATRPETLPPITVGAWTRVGSMFQGATDPSSLNDWRMDNAYVELHTGGKIHKKVGVTLNLAANMLAFANEMAPTVAGQIGSTVSVMDAIISLDFMDEVHLWAGHLLVPVDRANASGPFFMIPWNYPGFLTVGTTLTVVAPRAGPLGRNNGAVVWGDIAGGKLTYLAGVFDNANDDVSPLFSGRVRLALWDPEPGFWGNGSYFGEKDLLSIGVGAQYQNNGSTTMMGGERDWAEVNVDALVEKRLGGGSWVTGEVAYYRSNVNDGGIGHAGYMLGAYATPTIGVGNIQPMARFQWARTRGTGTYPWNLDIGVAYLIKGPGLRFLATYGHTTLPVAGGDITANSVQLGAQAIFF